MCQKDYNIKAKKFKHIIYEERLLIEHLYNKQKKSYKEIGEELGKHRTTIYREIKRGLVEIRNSDWSTKEVYDAEKAQRTSERNSESKGPGIKIGKEHKLADYIVKKIVKEKYSPEVISNQIKEDERWGIKLSYKTIYNYIDKGILLLDRKDLTYGKYKKKKVEKKTDKASRRKLKNGRMISDRPKEVERREELGHWEMDLVEGKKKTGGKVLLVLSERSSRREIIELLANKTQESVIKALDRIERRIGVVRFREEFKTITTDNGSEFLNYKGIESSYTGSKKARTKQYFANAYSSWQRGTNENINKMIRRFLPKGMSFKNLTQKEVKRIENWINNYPRKMFGFKSSNEVYKERMKIKNILYNK